MISLLVGYWPGFWANSARGNSYAFYDLNHALPDGIGAVKVDGINDSGDIVGWAETTGAFIFHPSGLPVTYQGAARDPDWPLAISNSAHQKIIATGPYHGSNTSTFFGMDSDDELGIDRHELSGYYDQFDTSLDRLFPLNPQNPALPIPDGAFYVLGAHDVLVGRENSFSDVLIYGDGSRDHVWVGGELLFKVDAPDAIYHAINNSHTVAGEVGGRAWVSGIGDIGAPDHSRALAINDLKQVVGEGNGAFLYSSESGFQKISSLVGLTGITLTTATGINNRRQIVGTWDGDRPYRLTPFTKYKQFLDSWSNQLIDSRPGTIQWEVADGGDGNYYEHPYRIDPNGHRITVNGHPLVSNFRNSGCTITSLATIAGLYGSDITPLQMRDLLLRQGLLDKNANTDVAHFHLRDEVNRVELFATQAGPGLAKQLIINQLSNGEPVILEVPTKGSIDGGVGFHYIVAYGIRPGANLDAFDPSNIFISDPGNGSTLYSPIFGANYNPEHEERLDITLQNYIDQLNAKVHSSFNPTAWFDSGEFTVRGQVAHASPAALQHLVTSFSHKPPFLGFPPDAPFVQVASPVELILTDIRNGQRYVSTDTLLEPGDILLSKSFLYMAGLPAELTDDAADEQPTPFPPYSLSLPGSLSGVSLNVQLIGIGSGGYQITYRSGRDTLAGSDDLVGQIEPGQVVMGQFTVTAIPEPDRILLIWLMMVSCAASRAMLWRAAPVMQRG